VRRTKPRLPSASRGLSSEPPRKRAALGWSYEGLQLHPYPAIARHAGEGCLPTSVDGRTPAAAIGAVELVGFRSTAGSCFGRFIVVLHFDNFNRSTRDYSRMGAGILIGLLRTIAINHGVSSLLVLIVGSSGAVLWEVLSLNHAHWLPSPLGR